MPLHPEYKCKCQAPNLQRHLGEDTGLCSSCNLVYDEALYEMRLRQHVEGFTHESVHEYLLTVDPHYRSLIH